MHWCEVISGIQRPISEKFIHAAVNLVRSRLGGDIDDTASRVAELALRLSA